MKKSEYGGYPFSTTTEMCKHYESCAAGNKPGKEECCMDWKARLIREGKVLVTTVESKTGSGKLIIVGNKVVKTEGESPEVINLMDSVLKKLGSNKKI